jgi:hypothetical protein
MIWVELDRYNTTGSVHQRVTTVSGSNTQLTTLESERPHYGGGWFVRDDIHEWLSARVGFYRLVWNEIKDNHWHVGIEDPRIAVLFKLTWCGN